MKKERKDLRRKEVKIVRIERKVGGEREGTTEGEKVRREKVRGREERRGSRVNT